MGKLDRLATRLDRRAICVCCLALGVAVVPGSAIAGDKLVLQLHREPQFEFAGYYAALWKGFYREVGLEVEIKQGAAPGGRPIDPVREVTERCAQFGTEPRSC
jgi:ABC-type nitrate/sulfonate/bicarbonate transport system substrate-binding protein